MRIGDGDTQRRKRPRHAKCRQCDTPLDMETPQGQLKSHEYRGFCSYRCMQGSYKKDLRGTRIAPPRLVMWGFDAELASEFTSNTGRFSKLQPGPPRQWVRANGLQ